LEEATVGDHGLAIVGLAVKELTEFGKWGGLAEGKFAEEVQDGPGLSEGEADLAIGMDVNEIVRGKRIYFFILSGLRGAFVLETEEDAWLGERDRLGRWDNGIEAEGRLFELFAVGFEV